MGVIFDPILGQLRTADAGGGGGTGTVASVSVVTANGVSGTVANPTTTPAITLALGAITPTSVNSIVLSGSTTPTLAVTGISSISGANTGDQTITLTGAVTGSGTGSFATTIATPGTLTVSSTNSTATAHTHAITSSSAPGAAASLLATDASGIIGTTATRIVKGWFTDLTVTNAIAGSITGNAATVTTNANLTGGVTSVGNAATVVTNANLTGPITSVGNATSIASQTGTGTKFVVDTSPVLVTPTLGVATATSINKVTITAPATSATLTLVTGSSLITAGAFALTLTSTATSNATIPAGTNTLYSTLSGSITSAQLATSLSDETGSGSAVFATSPTLVTPVLGVATATSINKVAFTAPTTAATFAFGTDNTTQTFQGTDTIVGRATTDTLTNKDLSSSTNIMQTNKLGYAQITSTFSTASTTAVQATGLTTTVTIPAGGRSVKITAFASGLYNGTSNNRAVMSIWDGTVGSGTELSETWGVAGIGSSAMGGNAIAFVTPAAGSKTYNVGLRSETTGTSSINGATTAPAFILVELI